MRLSTKRLFAFALSLLLLIPANISYANTNYSNTEKILGIARIVTHIKYGNKSIHYARVNGAERKVDLDNDFTFNIAYDLASTGRDPKRYKILSAEAYNGSNFEFGSNVYDYTQVFNPNQKNHYFSAQAGFLENKEHFYYEYSPNVTPNIRINSSKMNAKGFEVNVTGKLSNGLNYVSETKDTNKKNLPHLEKLLGGSNIDSEGSTLINNLKNASVAELNNLDGYVFFVPYVIELEKIQDPDIIVYDGNYEQYGDYLYYQYKVRLEGIDQVENVKVRDNNDNTVVIPLLEKNKPILMENNVDYPNGKPVEIDIFVNPDKNNPNNEITYDNNIYQVGMEADLELVRFIMDKEHPANVDISVPVEVKNNSKREYVTEVSLKPGTKIKPVRLAPGESKVLVFTYRTPSSGSLTLTAEINPKRSIEEKDYSNNKKSITITTRKIAEPPAPGGPCEDTVQWTEIDGRWETRYDTDENGDEYSYQVWVNYEFEYQAEMKTSITVTDDKGGQANSVTIKSGYGIKVNTSSSITVRQLSGE